MVPLPFSHLRLSLATQLLRLLLRYLLINLSSLAGLVAMCPGLEAS